MCIKNEKIISCFFFSYGQVHCGVHNLIKAFYGLGPWKQGGRGAFDTPPHQIFEDQVNLSNHGHGMFLKWWNTTKIVYLMSGL
jgi:hypothetical protein